jgi:hypothetical protein
LRLLLLGAAGLAGIFLLMLGWLRLLHRAIAVHWNSDLFFIRSLYEDAFVNGRGLAGWNLPPAPYFFPDMLLLFPSFALNDSLFGGYLLYGALLIPIFLLGVHTLMRELGAPAQRAAVATFSAALLFVAAMQGTHPSMLVFFLPIFHAGAAVAGVWLLAGWARGLRLGYTPGLAAVVLALSVALTLSDLFSVTQLFVPMALTIGVLRLRGRVDPAAADATFALIGAAAVIDLIVLGVLGWVLPVRFVGNPIFAAFAHQIGPLPPLALGVLLWLGWRQRGRVRQKHLVYAGVLIGLLLAGASIARPDALMSALKDIHVKPGWPMSAIRLFAHDLGDMARHSPLIWALAFLVPVTCGAWLWRRTAADGSESEVDSTREAVALFFVISTGVGVVAAALEWVGAGWPIFPELEIYREGTTRHMQPLFVYPIFALATAAALSDAPWQPRFATLSVIALLGYAAVRILAAPAPPDGWATAPHHDYQQCLDSAHESQSLSTGYGDYWTARSLSYASRAGVHIRPLREPMVIEHWVHSMAGFLPLPDEGRAYDRYDFIVPSRFSVDQIEGRFGPPARSVDCGGLDVLVYDRPSDIAFRNFVRIAALIGAGRRLPSGVGNPSELASYVPDGTPVARAAGLALAPGELLEVTFEAPAAGDVLELAADVGHAFEVLPRSLGGESWPPVYVPVVNGEGVGARFVRLPGDERTRWTGFGIRVVESPRSESAWLGHLFVYPDTH